MLPSKEIVQKMEALSISLTDTQRFIGMYCPIETTTDWKSSVEFLTMLHDALLESSISGAPDTRLDCTHAIEQMEDEL